MKKKKLKFDFKPQDYVDPHIIRLYLLSLVGILLIALLVVVGVTLYRSFASAKAEDGPGLYTEEDISSILKSPGLTDFIIPESLESGVSGFTMYREPMKEWSTEMVDKYIIPPDDLGIEQIRQDNIKTLENKLDQIP